jgi:hypothetical protein
VSRKFEDEDPDDDDYEDRCGRPPKRRRAVRVARITTLGGVASELSRVYRAARHGRLDLNEAARLAGILKIMKEVLDSADAEAKMLELERQLDALSGRKVITLTAKKIT